MVKKKGCINMTKGRGVETWSKGKSVGTLLRGRVWKTLLKKRGQHGLGKSLGNMVGREGCLLWEWGVCYMAVRNGCRAA